MASVRLPLVILDVPASPPALSAGTDTDCYSAGATTLSQVTCAGKAALGNGCGGHGLDTRSGAEGKSYALPDVGELLVGDSRLGGRDAPD